MRVFIGVAPNHEDAESQAALEYTLRKHASRPVDITWMRLSRDPDSPFYSEPESGNGWRTEQWPTPFSGFRWAVPALCGFEGRAVYTDSDVIFRADVAELYDQEMGGYAVLGRGGNRLCVSRWDCAEAREQGALEVAQLMSDPAQHAGQSGFWHGKIGRFAGAWNVLDALEDESGEPAKAIHYTSMPHQPHLVRAILRLKQSGRKHWFDGLPTSHWRKDLIQLFDDELFEAEAAGYTVPRYCDESVFPLFGDYPKGSVRGLRGTIPSWGR